jgi:ubiquitin C-terminal hydrolase
VSCQKCFTEATKEDIHNIVKLPFSSSVCDSFILFNESPDETSQLCLVCGTAENFITEKYFSCAPKILICQILRFALGPEGQVIKNNSLMTCNERITINEQDRQEIVIPVKYKLSAIVSHHGTYSSGHYTIQGRDEKSGNIFTCNDQIIIKVIKYVHENAYLLVYKRI